MYCPACGQHNPVGSQRCRKCGSAFTLEAAYDGYGRHNTDDQPYNRYDADSYASYATGEAHAGRSRIITISVLLIIILAAAIGALIGTRLITDSVVKPAISRQVEDDLDSGIRSAVQQELVIPDGSAPAPQITISEADINANIDGYDLGPLDTATVNLAPDGVSVDLKAYGLSGTYRANLAVVDGSIALKNGKVSGPLKFVVPADELENVANVALSEALNDAGYRVGQVTLNNDMLTIVQE